MDRHYSGDTTWHQIQYDHAKDLALQEEFGVQFLTYWFDEGRQTTFCLVSAPSTDVIEDVHAAAHGAIPNDVVEVDQGAVMSFMGRVADMPADDQPDGRPVDPAFRAIMFTDIVGYTSLTERLGDLLALELVRSHNELVRVALRRFGGREVKHTGDGFMASFNAADTALECAVEIQRDTIDQANVEGGSNLMIRVGLSAGEPIQEHEDLFGHSVNLASRLCDAASPGEIYFSREFVDSLDRTHPEIVSVGEVELKGFTVPQIVSKLPKESIGSGRRIN
jgi:class 3 adenylate cyclase